MYEDKTVESIKADILSRITSMETREGSFANDMAAGVALEIWKVYQAANSLIAIAFVDETSGPYIDKRVAEYGKYRKAGTKSDGASHDAHRHGRNGVVKKGKVFLTASGLQFRNQRRCDNLRRLRQRDCCGSLCRHRLQCRRWNNIAAALQPDRTRFVDK